MSVPLNWQSASVPFSVSPGGIPRHPASPGNERRPWTRVPLQLCCVRMAKTPAGNPEPKDGLGRTTTTFRDPVQVGRKPDLVFVLSEDAGIAGVIPLHLIESGAAWGFPFSSTSS